MSALAADVTPQQLMNADNEPQNWLMVNKDYSSHRYSELDQINKDNVKNLHVAFTVALGGVNGLGYSPLGGHQSTPLVNDGFMYAVDAWGAVYKIDVRDPASARITWMMDPGTNKADMFIGSNRGVALYKDYVVSVTGDCKVLWTKAETGELVKTVQFDDLKTTGCTLTSAPLVIDDKLIVGGSGEIEAHGPISMPITRTLASICGGPIRFRRPASLAATPGRATPTPGNMAADHSGRPVLTIRPRN